VLPWDGDNGDDVTVSVYGTVLRCGSAFDVVVETVCPSVGRAACRRRVRPF